MYILLAQYKLMKDQLDALTEQLIELSKEMTEYKYLNSVPGIGNVTMVELLSEVGFLTQYEHPRQLMKLAGLTLRENSSGQHKGQKWISKRGRRKLRALLFRVMIMKPLNNYMTITQHALSIPFVRSNRLSCSVVSY